MTLTSDAISRFRDAERRLLAGEISRPQFDAVAGSVVAVLAGAAEREAKLRGAANVLAGAYSTSEYHQGMKMLRAALETKGGE